MTNMYNVIKDMILPHAISQKGNVAEYAIKAK